MITKRTIGIGLVIILLVIGSATATIVYPLRYDSHEPRFNADAPIVPYSAEGEIMVDGEAYMEYESAVASDAESAWTTHRWYNRDKAHRSPVKVELYWSGDYVHKRVQSDDQDILNGHTEGETVVNATVDPDSGEAIIVDGDTDPALQYTRDELYRILVKSLAQTTYDPLETKLMDGTEVRVYEPENGWFGGYRPYRVTNTSGVVHLDIETQRVQYADVTFDMTWSDNYLDYLDNRNDTRTVAVRYDRSAAPTERDSPGWTINHE